MMRIFDKQIYRTDIRIRSMELKHGRKENMRERESSQTFDVVAKNKDDLQVISKTSYFGHTIISTRPCQ